MMNVNDLCTEVLSVCPGSSTATVVIGLTQKGFRPGHEPGNVDKSIGFKPSTGWWLLIMLICTVQYGTLTVQYSDVYYEYYDRLSFYLPWSSYVDVI